ncbi:hypothetical protein HYH02_005975 [Chlamydomonas schloesseri]|uniref:BHLH domain-containing protein n=1 Tax=Chlamydomonas schloesseri TaxID=2026947 RepID=A0A836B737_9CHLO|nr:hypothetical protein HYH02_005975 [Chlamydomonas schloesseri]|eukprot:KAG2449229.1 hypothetical protein HYH02_005975 [Chlamydomonas schloesseri]
MPSTTLTSGALMSGALSSPQGTPAPQCGLGAPGLPGLPQAPVLPQATGLPQPPSLPMGFPQLMVQVLPAQAALAAHLQQQRQQQSIAAALAPQLAAAAVHVHAAAPMGPPMAPPAPQAPARVASPTYRHTGRAAASETALGPRVPISHSTVEKQRRDRINSLIDELRDLVPPTQQQQQQQQQTGLVTIGVSDNPEASSRRPKHVVLADTINLLKTLRQRVSFAAVTAEMQQLQAGGGAGGTLPMPMPVPMPVPGMYGAVAGAGMVPGMPGSSGAAVKQEPQGSSSQDDDDTNRSGGPGVTVKKGPDCYYVQVTCPDRKGLLSDITDTLRNLSLEVRTAAVTTTGGSVRDVFEVVPPDGAAALAPEAVQSLVQGALSQRVAEGQQEVTAGKRPRA